MEVTVLEPGSQLAQIYVLFVTSYFLIFILLQVQSVVWPEGTVSGLKSVFLLITKCEGYYEDITMVFQERECRHVSYFENLLCIFIRILPSGSSG